MDNLAITQRTQLLNHRQWAKQKGIPMENLRPQILKLYALLTPTSDVLTFNTDVNMSSGITTENLLKRDSLLFVNLVGLALHKVLIFAAVKYPRNTQMNFYPDKNIFADAAAAPGVVPENQCLEAVYNGLLSFKTSQSVRLEDHPCNVFRSVPDTQNAATTYPSHGNLNLIDLNVSFAMSGQTNNKFTINIGSDADRNGIAGGAESANYAVLLLAGFEVVEGARAGIKADR